MKRARTYLVLAIGMSLALHSSAALAGKSGGGGGGGPKGGGPKPAATRSLAAAKPAMKASKPAQGLKPAGGIVPNAGGLRSVVKGPSIGSANSQLSNAAKVVANPVTSPKNLAGNVGNLPGSTGLNPGAIVGNPGSTGRVGAKPVSPIRNIGNPGNGSGAPAAGNGGNPAPGNGGTGGGDLDLNGPGTPGTDGGNSGAVPPGQLVGGGGPTGELEPAPGGSTGRNPSPDAPVQNPSPDNPPFDLPGAGDGLNPEDLFPMQPLPEPPVQMLPLPEPPGSMLPPGRPPLDPPAKPPVRGGIGISFPSIGGGTTVATTFVVAQPAAQPMAVDLELLEVRQLDLGDGATMGPAYRVTIRNRSSVNVTTAFDVTILGSLSRQLADNSPHASANVRGIRGGETLSVDVRLPIQALSLGRNAAGASVPFTWLTAAIDVAGQLAETNLDNNLITMNRTEIAMAE